MIPNVNPKVIDLWLLINQNNINSAYISLKNNKHINCKKCPSYKYEMCYLLYLELSDHYNSDLKKNNLSLSLEKCSSSFETAIKYIKLLKQKFTTDEKTKK